MATINEVMERVHRTKPKSAWSRMDEAKEAGITDGTRPQSFATREEVATMIVATMKKE